MTKPDDESALRRLIHLYAHCVDRRDGDGFVKLFTPDAVLEGGGYHFSTPEELHAVPGHLNIFAKTYHTVRNILLDVDGDSATSEVYSAAHHLTPQPDGKFNDLVMYITYRDRFARTNGEWRIKHRNITVEFTENHIAEMQG